MMRQNNRAQVIAIDGPSGSGKSTISRLLAQELGVLYIDTGAMFRALACYFYDANISLADVSDLPQLLNSLEIQYAKSSSILIEINGVDLTSKIREHFVSDLASEISQVGEIRAFLLDFQRNLALKNICVMEGRDIGSVVFPGAFSKFFVTASPEIRAKRRLSQLQQIGPVNVSLEQIKEDILVRDQKDRQRKVAPLVQSEGAILIDTTNLNTSEVLELMKKHVIQAAKEFSINLS